MPPQDSTGKTIKVGDQVRFRGRAYTISCFVGIPGDGLASIKFVEGQHTKEVATEDSVNLIPVVE